MSWSLFGILALVVYIVQAGVINNLDVTLFGVPPFDLFLVLALVYGLMAPRDDARLAAVLIGFAADLTGVGPIGVQAVALGLAAVALTAWRDALRTHLWVARVLLAFGAGVIAELITGVYARFWQSQPPSWLGIVGGAVLVALVAALIAAAVVRRPVGRRGRVLTAR